VICLWLPHSSIHTIFITRSGSPSLSFWVGSPRYSHVPLQFLFTTHGPTPYSWTGPHATIPHHHTHTHSPRYTTWTLHTFFTTTRCYSPLPIWTFITVKPTAHYLTYVCSSTRLPIYRLYGSDITPRCHNCRLFWAPRVPDVPRLWILDAFHVLFRYVDVPRTVYMVLPPTIACHHHTFTVYLVPHTTQLQLSTTWQIWFWYFGDSPHHLVGRSHTRVGSLVGYTTCSTVLHFALPGPHTPSTFG